MIGMEPTLGQDLQPTTSEFGVRSDDSGEFEAVLDDLLDSGMEQGEMGVLLFPHPLPPSLPLQREDISLSNSVGKGLGMRTDWTQPQLLSSLSEHDKGWTAPLSTSSVSDASTGAELASDLSLTAKGQMNEAAITDTATQVQDNGGSDAAITPPVERGRQAEPSLSLPGHESHTVLGGDFEQSVLEALSQTSDAPPPSDGDEGVSPVSSARQGETLSSLLTPDRETAELTARGMERASEPRRAPLGQDDTRDHASHISALHHAPVTHRATQTESSHSVQSAQPDWNAVDQVAQHIEWMVYNRERDSVTVRLDPPELGVIELRIQASGGEVQAWVSAERDLTRQLLQQTQQQLREQLESRGLQLTHFDVGGQSNPHFAQARPFRTPATAINTKPHPSTATDSLYYDGRWSVWV